uniref:Uncharacterized protein n=1 Tax=Tetranychus urticae TaxID=32264 RepID=T1JT07_TETUR
MIKMFEAKSSCNDECLTKTYCISSEGSGVCSKNNLVTARFKVVPVFGKYDYLQITLKGYNVAPIVEKTIEVSFDNPHSHSNTNSIYSCYKPSLGSTYARFDEGNYSVTTGSSYYKESVLSCTWTFNIDDTIYPLNVDLIKDSYQSISLHDDSKEVIVAQDTSQLPIYHAQYLKCCNKVHGNEFLLTFDQTEEKIRYQLYYWKYNSKHLTVTLTTKEGIKLQFECATDVDGYIINGTKRLPVDQQLIESQVIYSEICIWATPFVLGNSGITIDASTSVFDLHVEVESVTVYTEKDVVLNDNSESSSHLA